MPSERMQRQIDTLLDEAEASVSADEWPLVASKARAALVIDPDNADAQTFLQMAVANGVSELATTLATPNAEYSVPVTTDAEAVATPTDPDSFAGGRYKVLRFLGEGGKKRVFLAHDELLDRDIAFSLVKTEGLDEVGRQRIMREAKAMGRLTHQNIVSIYDIGEHVGPDGTKQPYLVQELMGGGDVEGLLEDADGPLPLRQSLDIALATIRGLEFAHAQGVVHRDLKPGNVWLTSEGEAKIGDLGLAVTLGQSRLTSHGMMVGTFQYMPPEHALGGESTPQADLYSLGAMLYEMVTGRTPFEGDTPTAVISQHLNTQPVAPSWHTEHCPPDLEALILHLLAKEPDKRPASAGEVREALEGVDPEARSVSHSDSQTNPLDRLARGVFVGREKELEQLHEALNSAMEGRGSVVMLVGEPGIGKTRTVQELETYARMRGAEVYWGRTHESAGMPAYWPWQQVGRAWAAQQDIGSSSFRAAVANPELVRLFPDLRQAIPDLTEPLKHNNPETAQFLLFDAYTQFIRAQSSETPWVVVLDDLHWADRPTLQLLQFVARELANMNVLVVATYRDTDLVRTHPLSETLAELNREGGFQRLVLKGLEPEQVRAYMRQRANVEPSAAIFDRVYEETEGNPFFLSEVVSLLAQEGTLDSSSVSDVALPDGVREALGRRLDRLSEEANELLQVAAVVGREFAHETLLLVEDRSEGALFTLIEEALDGRVIEESERAGRYRFTHALMQETLLGELSTTRKARLHGRIGEALEQRWGDGTAERAPLLAHHFTESATLSPKHAQKAVDYLIASAANAERVAAWADVADYTGQALELDETADVTVNRAELLLTHGKASRSVQANRDAVRSLMTAISLSEEAGDNVQAARAAIEVLQIHLPADRGALLIDRVVANLGDEDPHLMARLLALRASFVFLDEFAGVAADRAAELAERHDFEDVRAILLGEREVHIAWRQGQFEKAFHIGSEASGLLAEAGLSAAAGQALYIGLAALLARGEIDRWLGEIGKLEELAKRTGEGRTRSQTTTNQAQLSWWRGNFAAALDTVERISPVQIERLVYEPVLHAEIGNTEEALALLPEPYAERSVDAFIRALIHMGRARVLDLTGAPDEAAVEIAEWARLSAAYGRADVFSLWLIWSFGETLAKLAAEDVVSELYTHLCGLSELVAADRALGFMALRLGREDEAETHFADALEWASAHGLDIPLASSHVGLAELAEVRGDRETAREHLDAAGELFSQHGAKLYLDQVIAKKEILKA